MKKITLLILSFSLILPCIANATYHLNNFTIQNRGYEDGRHANLLSFDCVDANNNHPSTNILSSVVLTDPNGKNIELSISINVYYEIDCNYNASNGQWIYNSLYLNSDFRSNIADPLITGKYHLMITDKDGEVSESNFMVDQIVSLPIIPSSSYSFHLNQVGDLIWQWQVPDYIDPSLQTSSRASIDLYDDKNNRILDIFYKIPTQMGFLLIPKSIVDQIILLGNSFHFGTQIRTIDGVNRFYSTDLVIGK